MFDPKKLMKEYKQLDRGKARLSGIRYAIDQADMAKDYSYMLFFRYEYANSATEYEDGLMLHVYLIFPEMLKIFEDHPDIQMPECCYLTAVEAVKRIFTVVVDCADYFYQIPLSDMEQYFKKYKDFCLTYGYDLDDYFKASARFFRNIDDERALQSFNEYRKFIKARNIKNVYTIDFECEMEIYYDNLDKALEIAKPLLDGTYGQNSTVSYEYGRFLVRYMLGQNMDMEKAGHYYRLLTELRKKLRLSPVFFIDELLYLILTDLDAAWNFYRKEAYGQAGSTIPLCIMEFTIASTVMMKSLVKAGRQQVRVRFPTTLPCYREDGCYQTKTLAEYFDMEAKDIVSKFDARNGNDLCLKNYYKDYLGRAGLLDAES